MSVSRSIPQWLERNVGFRLLRLHDTVYRSTNGWIGHRVPGAPPSLLLHTVGAKTGLARTVSLTYARDGADYLIVASLAGADRSPGWYHNLKARPEVEINLGPRRMAVTARPVLPDADEYARLWRIVNANNSDRYTAYQRRTSRPIPVVVLTPR
ncbi:nitroreductase family deazaflavin-dependent oxidoreductase [Mycolicibacillus parakoreensis]|uniref:Nitroreductase family deazaflavin-dependent oxidoreductase n=1 Tax=Mycolicibacillus parakoreensis TaxID=1069221 RepID=A0ABY3U2D3_9MYCO|nr:nitroreductase family deazaflavin-dependent oxidoreductase [Mycolicibacillus parakoreensis]MCV7314975.1 nitroreductase family deazaflavin-dependent oxidoreductase [Mycolicibacillus parakoreensis]ULN53657.1 nitroreductase family deazaflavin-dependent oxidoreductase [Mycolicibacillus parakoreensis]